MADVFLEIGLIIILATIGGYMARIFKQPLAPAYMLAGIFLGPVFGLITNSDLILKLSEIGIAFLLFIVGLELEFKRLKDIGIIASIGGTIQIAVLFIFGFAIAIAFGYTKLTAVYLGLVIAFSSTMIVVKLLSDKKQLDTLHGRIILGLLLMQDIAAILALSILTTSNGWSLIASVLSLVKGALIVVLAIFCSKFVFPTVFKFAARSQELLLLVALSVCFLFSLLFQLVGFSIIIGSFIAGVALANLPYNFEIIGRVKSLRDFFATLFFTALGLQLYLGGIKSLVYPLLVFSVFVILVKPLVTMIIVAVFGYTKKTTFMTSLSLAQISEFSLIIVAQGLALGHISQNMFTLTTILAIVTMTLTAYFLKFDDWIYKKLSRFLDLFNFMDATHLEYIPKEMRYDIVLCGCDRIGTSILRSMIDTKKSILVVDFNPDLIRRLIKSKIPCIYGDIGDAEILDRLSLKNAKLVVSTVTKFEDNVMLLRKAKRENEFITVFVTADKIHDALELYNKGADYVILPHFLGGEHVSHLLAKSIGDLKKVSLQKFTHIEELKARRELGHEHPARSSH